jgi:site-specific DNA recombinase
MKMRFAYFGRTSSEDAQDPSLSIPRQRRTCEGILQPLGDEIVAHYWDIESGRKSLAERGKGADSTAFGITVPRDGGINDLLHDAAQGRFDAVIVESIDRLSRMTAVATRVEQELEHHGVGLFAADEPMVTNATAILTRRVKQGVAEWYVRDLLEKSRRGMEESVRQGWHTGGPVPYGYQLQEHQHPNPHKAREGKKKHRLIVEPIRAAVVLMIFTDYCRNALGMGAICDKLNRDLERFPPPARNPKDENGLPPTWSKSQIQSMLRNPKYTGYNVWNRHDKRKGRPLIRPREEWIWSATPTHEAIVPRDLFDMVTERAKRNEIRPGRRAPNPYPQRRGHRPGRLYPLRGRVRCSLCGRRMEGSHQKGKNWYRCRFVYNRGAIAADAAGHPRALGIKEEVILVELLDFMGRRIFGPDRLRLLQTELAKSASGDWQQHDEELKKLDSEHEQIERSIYRQTLRLEEYEDPNHPVIAAAKQRIEELTSRHAAVHNATARLKARRPSGVRPEEIVEMLDAIPDLRHTLASADPAELAEICDAFQITAVYDKANRTVELSATITPELLPKDKTPTDEHDPVGVFVYSGGGIRTRDLRVMSPTSYQTAPPRGARSTLAKASRPKPRPRRDPAQTAALPHPL